MQTTSDNRKLSEISGLGRRETKRFRDCSPEVKQRILDWLCGDITAAKIKSAVAAVSGKRKMENGK